MPGGGERGTAAAGATPLARNVDFLLLTSASAVSLVGTRISGLALPLLALALTDSPAWAGALGATRLLPYLALSLFAGAWVDRADRKTILVACDLIRFALLGSLPLAHALGVLSMLQLLVVLLVEGTCAVLFSLAELSALPRVVEVGQLPRARAITEGIESAAGVLGPGLGGLIIGLGRTTVAGAMLAYVTDAVSYLLSGLSLLFVRRRLQGDVVREPAGLGEATADGLRFLWGQRGLRALVALTTTVNFLQAPMLLGVVVLAQSRLGLTAAQLGVVFGVAGVAGVIGALAAPRAHGRLSVRAIAVLSTVAWALSAAIIGAAGSVGVLTAGWALTALVWPVYAVAVVTLRLTLTPDRLQGRVNSAFRTFSFGAEPLGLALGGLLIGVLDAPAVVALIALDLAAAAAGAWRVPAEAAA